MPRAAHRERTFAAQAVAATGLAGEYAGCLHDAHRYVRDSQGPKLNGTNLTGSTMRAALHGNGETTVVSRAAIIEADADDYIEVATACDSTNGSLKAFAASGISDEPACPATTLTIIRVHR